MEKPIQSSSMVPYLPPEVMTEILAKCPVKTLVKCRFVCKLWCSLISSRQFVRRHLSSRAGNTQRMICNRSDRLYDLWFRSVNDSMVLEETSIDIQIGDRRKFCIMGSCDGLICLKEEFSGKMLLWNPSTRESRMLPSTSEIGVVHVSGTCHEWRYGFGYDCNSDDYKVLTLMTEEFACFNSSYKSIMYTLRTNSWRWIKDSPRPVGTYIAEKTSVFMNGALHWKAIVQRPCIAQKNGRSVVVVSFELTSETYTEVPLPQDVGVSSILHEVGASKGCLCFLSQDIYDGTDEIWVMKEYGVPESWTKTVKIPFVFGGIHCIRLMPMTWFVENGEILLNVRGKPASYNPNKDSIRYFATDDEVRVVYPECVSCEESLVSPNVYSNIVVNETCRLNIKIGHAVTKEEKDLEYEERKKQSSRAGMEIKAKKDRSLISFLNRFTSCLSIRRQI